MSKIHLSTSDIAPEARNDFWRTVIRPIYEIATPNGDPSETLRGEILSYSAGPLTIGTTSFSEQSYQRDKHQIDRENSDFYLIQFITSGDLSGDFEGRSVAAAAGDVVIIDLTQSVHSHASAGQRITTILARDAFNRNANWRSLHGIVLSADAPATRLITHFLQGVLNIAPELSAEEGASTQDAIINLIALALRSSPDIVEQTMGADAVNVDMKEQIIRFIENNIASTSLSVAMIQKRFHISRAHLYMIFGADHGIASRIKEKRLDFALRSLMKGQYSNVTAKQLAHISGFKSPELLNRLFREKFGMSPKELVRSGELMRLSVKSGFDLQDHMREQVLNAAQIINTASTQK